MASLVMIEGPSKGQQFALERHGLVLIGRDEQCTFQIVDPEISRMHLQIKLNEAENRHYAVDFDSVNGVYVNGDRIARDALLSDGDVIQIGASTIVYSVEDAPDAKRINDLLRKHGEGSLKTMEHRGYTEDSDTAGG